jgi:hypothetical protein
MDHVSLYSTRLEPARQPEAVAAGFEGQRNPGDRAPGPEWQNHPLWQDDPIMLPFRSLAEIGRVAGYAGPPAWRACQRLPKRTPSGRTASASAWSGNARLRIAIDN